MADTLRMLADAFDELRGTLVRLIGNRRLTPADAIRTDYDAYAVGTTAVSVVKPQPYYRDLLLAASTSDIELSHSKDVLVGGGFKLTTGVAYPMKLAPGEQLFAISNGGGVLFRHITHYPERGKEPR